MPGARIHHQAIRDAVERVALLENALGHKLKIGVGKRAAQDRTAGVVFRSDAQKRLRLPGRTDCGVRHAECGSAGYDSVKIAGKTLASSATTARRVPPVV